MISLWTVFAFYLASALFFTLSGIGYIFNIPDLVATGLGGLTVVCPLAVWSGAAQILETERGRPLLRLGRLCCIPCSRIRYSQHICINANTWRLLNLTRRQAVIVDGSKPYPGVHYAY